LFGELKFPNNSIIEGGSQEDIEAIINGEKSMKKVYWSITENNPQRVQKQETALAIGTFEVDQQNFPFQQK